MTTVNPEAPTASPAPRELSLSTFFTVEVMIDPDTGKPTLCTAADPTLGDFRETSPARALGMVEEIEARLVQAKRLIREHEARDTLAAILAEHHARMEEWDTDLADPLLRDRFLAGAYVEDGQLVVVVPLGQDPIERVDAVAKAVNNVAEQETRA
ncbi:hypothetical protein [Streptomyces sp. NPDC051572]|uniref:hypothetical protein n=1 Tax=Streptomyces sp. NPDC051572 TaxID=3155802 RepID=UPI00344BD7A1